MIRLTAVTLAFSIITLLTSCTREPSWQAIGENLDGYVACTDIELDGEGQPTQGYGPCVRLTDVSYDQQSGNAYCYSATPLLGGYQGQYFGDITEWEPTGVKYYCVSWSARYTDSRPDEPSDWRIDFLGEAPSALLQ